ncbi:MAG: hypothetical protein H0W12_11155 [Chitinophagaceae bacterium]|nr:hypothetical protein [Chitinophagaceae bacterium]
MVLIYTTKATARLQYTAAFIFKEIIKTPYAITSHADSFRKFDGVKINYTGEIIAEDELIIPNCGLLFESGVRPVSIDAFEFNGSTAFFKSPSYKPVSATTTPYHKEYAFDIFSATFYLLSRYEEYLPHEKDKYGRFHHTNSIAYKENFLHLPLINIWLKDFTETLKKYSPVINYQLPSYKFTPTYDIDIAWSFLNKGLARNTGGALKSLTRLGFHSIFERIKVLAGNEKDPFDNYDWLHHLHTKFEMKPEYFFLVAEKNGLYDKNISPRSEAMQLLIKEHSGKYKIGLHPSWQSGENEKILKNEKQLLEKITGSVIIGSRQHYLRFTLPAGYRRLLDAALTEDYSMGYGSTNGFRASVAAPFFWYDLEKEEQTKLRVHPFCFMDSQIFFSKKITLDQGYNELMHYYTVCKNTGSHFISIFHNHLLGSDNIEWRKLYERFLANAAAEKSGVH